MQGWNPAHIEQTPRHFSLVIAETMQPLTFKTCSKLSRWWLQKSGWYKLIFLWLCFNFAPLLWWQGYKTNSGICIGFTWQGFGRLPPTTPFPPPPPTKINKKKGGWEVGSDVPFVLCFSFWGHSYWGLVLVTYRREKKNEIQQWMKLCLSKEDELLKGCMQSKQTAASDMSILLIFKPRNTIFT